jgi:hypothetical protein
MRSHHTTCSVLGFLQKTRLGRQAGFLMKVLLHKQTSCHEKVNKRREERKEERRKEGRRS